MCLMGVAMSTTLPVRAVLGACALFVLSPLPALAQNTEYVIRAPAPKAASADGLKAQLMDLISAQAPTLESLRAEEQALRDRQKPELDRLNNAVQELIESQRETRDALTSERHKLRDAQSAYLSLHPDASEADIDKLRATMQALKERQQPIRDKMKSDLLRLIDSQKPERDALRAERETLREAQRPTRDRLLAEREALETRIAAAEDETGGESLVASAPTGQVGSSGLAGLEAFAAPTTSNGPSAPSTVTVDWPKPTPSRAPVTLAIPTLPPAPVSK